MKEEKKEFTKSNLLWKYLKDYAFIMDDLKTLGMDTQISIPTIVVLGNIKVGKSSVIESILGVDLIPKDEHLFPLHALELNLHHLRENEKPWIEFEEIKEKRFYNFIEAREQIFKLLDKKEKIGKYPNPIKIGLYSYYYPDMILIEALSFARIPIRGTDAPLFYENFSAIVAKQYCENTQAILLPIISANCDITCSDPLKFAFEWDPNGGRTLGVITKIDIMDKGTHCKKELMNTEIVLKQGYVGVINRNAFDIRNNVGIEEGMEKERIWFQSNPLYKTVPQELLGTESLVCKISRMIISQKKAELIDIKRNLELSITENTLKGLSTGDKYQTLLERINKFIVE